MSGLRLISTYSSDSEDDEVVKANSNKSSERYLSLLFLTIVFHKFS